MKTINLNKVYEASKTQLSGKKSFGEVFTPNELIEEMLGKLPSNVWKNPDATWLDPASGVGNFFAAVYNRLMAGLEEVIPDEVKRSKHILSKMLYFVELQEKNVRMIHQLFDLHRGLKLNVFTGDFAEFTERTFSIQKFDIVLGNPPYQHMHTNTLRKAKNHNLWSLFIEKGFEFVKDGGYLLYVTPPAWMSPSSKVLNEIFLKYQLHFVNINECSRHFKGIGSKFSYYLIEKSAIYAPTRFVYLFLGGSNMRAHKGESSYLLHSGIKFIPQLPTAEAFKILEKTVFSDRPKFAVKYDSDLHKFTKKDLLSSEKTGRYRYKVLHTPSQILWSSRPHKNQNVTKVLIPLTTYFEQIIIEDCGNTQGMGYILCESREEAELIKKVLLTKLYRFIANITRWSNFNVPLVMQNLPKYRLGRTQEDVMHRFFGITSDELKMIQSVYEIPDKSAQRTLFESPYSRKVSNAREFTN